MLFCLQDCLRLHIRSALFCFSVLPLRLAVRFQTDSVLSSTIKCTLLEHSIVVNQKGRYCTYWGIFLFLSFAKRFVLPTCTHFINFSEPQHHLPDMDCRSQRIFLHPLSLRKPDRPAVFQIPGFQALVLLHRHGSVRKH